MPLVWIIKDLPRYHLMPSVPTNENQVDRVVELKKRGNELGAINPFYSPSGESVDDDTYKYNAYKVREVVHGLLGMATEIHSLIATLSRRHLGTPQAT